MKKASYLFKSNAIFDSVQDKPFPGFVAVVGNTIAAVGELEAASSWIDADTKIVDCGDRMIMPGFIDAHFHFFDGMFISSRFMLNGLTECRSERECADKVKEFAAAHRDYDRISGMGWHNTFWDDWTYPSRASLDEAVPDRPVYLLAADAHTFWLNSAALAECGITPDTQVFVGSIQKDEKGQLTGLLFEIEADAIAMPYAFSIPAPQAKAVLSEFCRSLAACGLTSVADMAAAPELTVEPKGYAVAHALEQEGNLGIRLHLYPSLGTRPDTKAADALREKYSSERLRIAGLKQFVDGVTATYTAVLLEPYEDRADYCGIPNYPYETYRDCVINANKNGYDVRLHCIGDGAIRMGLNAFEVSREVNGNTGIRNSLEHLEGIAPEDLPRFAALNVTASMQPMHVIFDKNRKTGSLGAERSRYQWPFHSLLSQGAVLAFGTDHPVVSYNPLLSVCAAVTRSDADGTPISPNPEEKITLSQALRAYTSGSAYSLNRENLLGTLEAGKLADLVVLDRNLFEIPSEQIRDASADLTMVDGRIVFYK